MSQCPGCHISYCLDCEKSVEPNVYRCEPCRIENERTDPFAQSAREYSKRLSKIEAAGRSILDAVYIGNGRIVCPAALEQPIRELVKAMKKGDEEL